MVKHYVSLHLPFFLFYIFVLLVLINLNQLYSTMSYRSPASLQPTSFSPSAKSYKRRSLQSPYILNDLSGDADHLGLDNENQDENDTEDAKDTDDTEHIFNFDSDTQSIGKTRGHKSRHHHSGFIQPAFPEFDDLIYNNSNNNNFEDIKINDRHSLQPMNPKSNHRSHKRSSSTVSINYTPNNMPPPSSSIKINTPPMQFGTLNSGSPSTPPMQPFQFNSMIMNNNSSENLSTLQSPSKQQLQPQVLPKASYRRGHRYKHSSVSMNMFQDPQRISSMSKTPNLPKSYAIPTAKEIISMITSTQYKKIGILAIQILLTLTIYIQGFKYDNSCLLTLSHLLFYDILSNLSIITVEIMSNFDIWKLSTLKYPFGLGRIEILFGFALSVSLLFVGLDLTSHITEEILINFMGKFGHSHHNTEGIEMNGIFYEMLIISIIVILFIASHIINGDDAKEEPDVEIPAVKRLSSITLREPRREKFVKRVNKKLGIKINSTMALSLFYSAYSLCYPFLSKIEALSDHDTTEWINHISTVVMAIIIDIVAWRLIWKLGNILLLGSPSNNDGGGVHDIESKIVNNIMQLEVFKSDYHIDEVKVARVNPRISIVIVRVDMGGASDDDEAKLRFYAMRVVRGVVLGRKGNAGGNAAETEEDQRRSLIDVLNVGVGEEEREGERLEITIDIRRL